MNNEACTIFVDLLRLMIRLMPIFVCMDPKVKNKENIAAISINIWVIMIFLQFLLPVDQTDFIAFQMIFSAIFFLLLMVFFEGSLIEKTFLYISAWLFDELTVSICSFFVWLLTPYTPFTAKQIEVLVCFIWACIVCIYIYFNVKPVVKQLFEEFSLRRCAVLIAFPIISLILLFAGHNTIFSSEFLEHQRWEMTFFYLLLSIMICLIYVLLLNSIFGIVMRRETEEKLQFARQMLSQQSDHYNRILEYSEQVRLIKHDFRHHIYALLNMGKEEQTEYLKKLQKEMDSTTGLIYCQNVSVNGLIHGYETRTKKINVIFTVKMDLPDRVPIDDLSLCIVIGNLLENALEACKRYEGEKFITIKGRWLEDHLLLLVENSYRGQIKEKEGKILSSKKNGGLGLLSVRRVLNQPGDDLDIVYTENTFTAMVKMMSRL